MNEDFNEKRTENEIVAENPSDFDNGRGRRAFFQLGIGNLTKAVMLVALVAFAYGMYKIHEQANAPMAPGIQNIICLDEQRDAPKLENEKSTTEEGPTTK